MIALSNLFGLETFLINEQSKIEYIWDKVRVKGHVEDVIDKIKTS